MERACSTPVHSFRFTRLHLTPPRVSSLPIREPGFAACIQGDPISMHRRGFGARAGFVLAQQESQCN